MSRKIVRKVRTAHGTRVARRIVCSKCGASDTLDFAPKDPSAVLCRKCAFDQHGVVDPDDPSVRMRRVTCTECKKSFEAAIDPERSDPIVCSDCRAGIVSQQRDRARGAQRLSARVVRARRPPEE
jgi:hypothetical protein